jgi:signal transduction histidine kinase
MKKTSLNQTFTLSITLFTLCVIGAITWFSYHQEQSVLIVELQRHGISLAENLAHNSEYGLLFTDVDGLTKLADGVVQDKDVLYAVIMTAEGGIVAEKDFYKYSRLEQITQKRFPEFLRLLNTEQDRSGTTRIYAPEDKAGIYDIFVPVFVPTVEPIPEPQAGGQEVWHDDAGTGKKPELLGVVVVGISFDRITHLLRQIQIQILELALFIVILAIIVARFLVSTVSRPIEKLAYATRRIAKGDLTQEVQITSSNEIGELAQSFNSMMHDLRSSREELELWAQTLENRVQERTREIQEKNEVLTSLIEEMKRIQEQLVHSEKMASLGQLVAGIAHEINNPVNFISSNITPLKNYITGLKQLMTSYDQIHDLTPDQQAEIKHIKQIIDFEFLIDDLDTLIKDIETGSGRIKQIVQDLRNFSRLDEAELKTIDIHESLDTTLNLLGHLYENRITVHKQYGDIPPVECYAGQLNQVFMNLLANAAQAINRKGNVWITTSVQDEEACPERSRRVCITIRDDGVGIPEDVLLKIFDPFFTTKGIGEGTGLGLSISYGIIEKHQGKITVHSHVGEGTEFTIVIPRRLSTKL